MTWRGWLIPPLATGAVLLVGWAAGTWAEGSQHEGWTVVFDGYGRVREESGAVVLEPARAKTPDVTHGGLVITTQPHPAGTDFAITLRTEEQVRVGEPNVWEVAWVLWNYQDNDHFYAVALKENGWEISKQDPAYPGKQRFLLTGTAPRHPVAEDYRVRVTQDDGAMSVFVDDALLGTVRDTERPYTEGHIGLYTEDARVRFSDLTIMTHP